MSLAVPNVSIVIPTYNQADMLKLALESIRAQTEPDWEAVIVNNFSEDHTREVVQAFDDPRLRFIDFRNHGVIGASRNKGIKESRSEWVAFLDSDDVWAPEKLEKCLAVADGADMLSHRESTVQDGVTLSVSPHLDAADATYRRLLFSGNCFSTTAVMVRRDRLIEMDGFTEDPQLVTCEDYDLWLRLMAAKVRVRFINADLSIYRLHGTNASAATLRHMQAGLNAVERHYQSLEVRRIFDGIRYRLRRSMVIYGAARKFSKAHDYSEARRYFRNSLLVFPLNPRALVFGALSLFCRNGRSAA